MLQDQDHENKINLKTLEGEEEILVDKLEDIGVYSLNKDQSVEWGTYTNKFSCNSVSEEQVDESSKKEIKLVTANFAEQSDEVTLKIVTWIVDGDINDREIYWFDQSGSNTSKDNPNFSLICENLDIFFDEM